MIKKASKITEGIPFIQVRTRFSQFLKFTKSILFLSIFFFQSCLQPTEGCLDVKATNFDVTASKDCSTKCSCTYPSLVLTTNYICDASTFNFNTTYKNDIKDSFRIVSAQMYLSGFQILNAQNKIFTTIDSVALTRATDTIKVLNNYALVGKSNGFSFTIGSFNSVDNFTKIKFRVGLDDIAKKTVPSKMPSTHPLSTKADSMYISSNSQYIFNKFVIASGANFKDTLRLNITTNTDLEFVKVLSFTEGVNATIPLTVNYLQFFSGVKFSSDLNTIQAKVVANTKNALSIQ